MNVKVGVSRSARNSVSVRSRAPSSRRSLLPATDAEPEAVLQVPTVRWRLRAFDDTSHLWVTGDLDTKFAAVLTPDLGSVFVVKASHYPPRRALLREIALGGETTRNGKRAGGAAT
jgi:hypothetical protein